MNATETLTAGDRLSLTLDGLCRAVAARIAGGAMAAAMIVLVWTRIKRVDRLMKGLLERFRAGRLVVRTSPRAGAGGARGGSRVGRGSGVTGVPQRFGWLLQMVPFEAANFAGQVRTVLAEPEMVALLAASPQARRVLRPLCRMLGVEASVLTPGVVAVAAEVADAPPVEKKVRVRKKREKQDLGRVPIPRGVMSAVRRGRYGKV